MSRFIKWGVGSGVAVLGTYGAYNTFQKSRVLEDVDGGSGSTSGQLVAWPVKRVDKASLSDQSSTTSKRMPTHGSNHVVLPTWTPPSREHILERLEVEEYDVLVIGGGATGSGVAMDCAMRGLKVALVERDDFASGTSSKSTKLIHGGIRYLAQAFQSKIPPNSLSDVFTNLRFDKSYLDVVSADLEERAFMIQSAPFMTRPIPMMMPLYRWWEEPMMLVVGKLYDMIAGRRLTVPPSHLIPRSEALYQFPALKHVNEDGQQLRGALVIYDGQQNDTRMNLHIALTAVQNGATAANHCAVESLTFEGDDEHTKSPSSSQSPSSSPSSPLPSPSSPSPSPSSSPSSSPPTHGHTNGAVVVDGLTGKKFRVKAKQVINAAGVFSDAIRHMAEPAAPNIMVPGPGSHLVLPDYMSPATYGLVWFTADGRVLYLLPWEGSTIAGTTDNPGEVTFEPRATNNDINFILSECNRVLSTPVDKTTIRSCWCGLRPLVRDPDAPPADTKALSREHVVEVLTPSNLVTVAGGKWTTYRKMAEDAVDKALNTNERLGSVKSHACQTSNARLIGADRGGLVCHRNFDEVRILLRENYGMDKDVATHLCHNYGTRALQLADMAMSEQPGRVRSKPDDDDSNARVFWNRLVPQHPELEAEVVFAARYEFAETAVDVIARRTRLAFLDVKATLAALPRVLDIMQVEKGWSSTRKEQEREAAIAFLNTMYLPNDHDDTVSSSSSSPLSSSSSTSATTTSSPPISTTSELEERLLY